MNNLQTLLNEFVIDPENDYNNLWLAKHYHSIGQTASAVSYYTRTAERTKDQTLMYACLLAASECFHSQGSRNITVKGLLQSAVALCPKRPEGYYLLSRFYERMQNWHDSYLIASIGIIVSNFDCEDLPLIVDYPGKYGLLFEKAVSSWHCGLCNESRDLLIDLKENYDLNEIHTEAVDNNIKTVCPNYIVNKKKDKSKLNGFPTVYYISLEEDVDRRTNLIKTFNEYGVKNINGIISKRYKECNDILHGRHLNTIDDITKGCFTSHMRAIKKWLNETDEPIAFFCEDDLSLKTVKYWNFTWTDFENSLPSDWDCVQLMWIRDEILDIKFRKRLLDDWSCTAYILKREHAKKLINTYHPNDDFYVDIPETSCYTDLQPMIENILYSFGTVYTFPLFVEEITKFNSTRDNIEIQLLNHDTSYHKILNWWENNVDNNIKTIYSDCNNTSNFVFKAIDAGGSLTKIKLEPEENTIFLTASILMNWDNRILLNLRNFNQIYKTNFNHLGVLNSDFQIEEKFIVDISKFDTLPLCEYNGLEDARLVKWDGKMYLCGNNRYDTPVFGRRRIYLSEIQIINGAIYEVSRYCMPAPENNDSHLEKNWMPILDMPYHFIRWSNPTEIVKYDIETNITTVVHKKQQNSKLQNLRGGSQVISWNDGYLAVVHENYYKEDSPYAYKYGHRFVFWDKDWNLTKISKEFVFFTDGTEFCAGLIYHDNEFILSFSINECENFIIKCPSSVVEKMLKFDFKVVTETETTVRKKIGFDIGACIGETISKFDGFDKIYAFEPAPYMFNILIENHKNDSRIEFHQTAISDENSVRPFRYHQHYGYSSFLEIDNEGEFAQTLYDLDPGFDNVTSIIDVQTKRLDTFMQENYIEHIDFLKIDTQGTDLNVIKSLGKMIDKVDTIEMEVQTKPLYKNSSSKEEIIDFMNKSNFNLILQESNHPDLSDYEERLTFKQNEKKSSFLVNENSKSTSWIVDNFYDTPDLVREFALQQEYVEGGFGRGFIGRRTEKQFLFPYVKEKFESIMSKPITKWEEHGMNGRFQICWSGEPLVYHCDQQQWGGMLYLTPNAPYQCGTTLYAHKQTRARTFYEEGWDASWKDIPGDCHLDGTPWEPVDVLGNVYNRLVIFDASAIHSASEYFGTVKENARLWQMFFFDT